MQGKYFFIKRMNAMFNYRYWMEADKLIHKKSNFVQIFGSQFFQKNQEDLNKIVFEKF